MNGEAPIDFAQVRALMKAFFRMNFRGSARRIAGRRGANWGFWGILIFYVLFGGLVSATAFVITNPMFYFLLMHGITFTLVGMAALVESGQILFNPNEDDVLGALPISPRTLVTAKMLNLAGFTYALTLAFNFIPMFVSLHFGGLGWQAPLAHAATLGLHCLFCCGIVVMLYGVVAKLAGRERFESFVATMQVAMSVFFIVGYQLMGPMMRQFHDVDARSMPYLWLLPPRWFAALDTGLAGGGGSAGEWIGGMWAVTATALALWIGLSRLTEGRERQAALAAEIRKRKESEKPAEPAIVRPIRTLAPWLRWWMPDPAEAGAFRLAAAYLRRDREIQRRLVPSMAMTVLLPVVFIINSRGTNSAGTESLFYVYMCLWMVMTLPLSTLQTLRMSKDWQAADLFRFSPLENGAALFMGARKAALYYITFPCLAAAGGMLALVAQDPLQTFWIALPVLIPLPAFSLMVGINGGYLPLSEQPKAGEQSRKTQGIYTLMMFAAAALMFAVHGLAKAIGYWPALAAVIPVSIAAQALAVRALRRGPALQSEP